MLMEEDRKQNLGKERGSHHTELHLGEHRNNNNWKNSNKRKSDHDLRDKINFKRDQDQRHHRDDRRDKR